MESDKPSRPPAALLWGIACAAQAIAATLEASERHYLQAAVMYCSALLFLLLATGGVKHSRWRTYVLYLIVLALIVLILYRFIGKRV